jgi:YD repeat-containing protein
VTQTTYDNLGRVVSTIHNYQSGQPASATVNVQTSTTYNGLGQVVSSTDATGAVTTMTYNGLGQVVSTTDPASRTTTMGERWQATPDGRVTVTQIDGLGRSMTTITNYRKRRKAPAFKHGDMSRVV